MGKVININRKEIQEINQKILDRKRPLLYDSVSENSELVAIRDSKVLSFEKEIKKVKEKEFIKLVITETPNFGIREESREQSPLKKELSDSERKEICDLIRKNTKSF